MERKIIKFLYFDFFMRKTARNLGLIAGTAASIAVGTFLGVKDAKKHALLQPKSSTVNRQRKVVEIRIASKKKIKQPAFFEKYFSQIKSNSWVNSKVSDSELAKIVSCALISGQRHNVSAALILGLIKTESNFDRNILTDGKYYGLAQMTKKLWNDSNKIRIIRGMNPIPFSKSNAGDIKKSVEIAATMLSHYIQKAGSEENAINWWKAGEGNKAERFRVNEVMSAVHQLRQK